MLAGIDIDKVFELCTEKGYFSFMEQLETALIQTALEYTKGNSCYAADLLGIHRTTLVEKRRRLGFKMGSQDAIVRRKNKVNTENGKVI